MRQADLFESTAGMLYRELSADKYRHWPYETVSLDDEMELVNEAIGGYWKPRFLMDYRTGTACEFMGADECLKTVTYDDIVRDPAGSPPPGWHRRCG